MTNQSDLQQWVRDQTATAYDYNGDWHALFDQAAIAAGDFNGRMLAWLNAQLGTSYSNINEAQNAYAISCGAPNWTSLAQGVPVYRTFNGVLCILLLGADNAPLQGADGAYLYGVA